MLLVLRLSETKTKMNIGLPGFVPFRRLSNASIHQGVTAVMVKKTRARHVTCADDQVLFKLQCIPNVYGLVFGYNVQVP